MESDLSSWRDARADRARALTHQLNESAQTRADFRRDFMARLRSTLDAFASEQGRARLAQASERAAHMEALVTEVNRLIGEYARDGAARDAAIAELSREVGEYLASCRSIRGENSAAQVSRNIAFRAELSAAVHHACVDDFR